MTVRRTVATTAGVLAAACTLALTCPAPASAASGRLVLYSRTGFQEYVDPEPGCYPGTGSRTFVWNDTDSRVLLFPDDSCRTRVYWPVEPYQISVNRNVGSVRVLDRPAVGGADAVTDRPQATAPTP
ncbi:hypothetical protein [Streptosporangium carneum]|uniref:Secreted protein n=1 Tax=Streptosporangium carneum TaxID=47481 RepID=A0A9W6MHF1_9ACTN|nr:hypothetical protein [Streptosporangium carneum]GLK14110.1 hypothetical protein GCM10017600_75220 [Streptosporangium carneum]